MKHIFILKLLLLFICIFTTFYVNSQGTFVVDNIMYSYDSNNSTKVSVIANGYSGSIVIPETVPYNGTQYTVTSIGKSAFRSCYNLTSISLPNSLDSIGEAAFWNCYSLNSPTIPSSVTSIGRGAFCYCYQITSINIPIGLTLIADSTFRFCGRLTTINLPSSVTSIGYQAFYACNLNTIILPSNVTSIGNYAFAGNSNWTSIQSMNPEPPVASNETFSGMDFAKCKIIIPVGSTQKYSTASGWNQYTIFEESISNSEESHESTPVKVYTESDLIVINGARNDETIRVYTNTGTQIKSVQAQSETVIIKLPVNRAYIIQIGNTSYKVVL